MPSNRYIEELEEYRIKELCKSIKKREAWGLELSYEQKLI
jgi:hypothetical protein